MYSKPADSSPPWHVAVMVLSSVIPMLLGEWARLNHWQTVEAVAGLALILPIFLLAEWRGPIWGWGATAVASLYLTALHPGITIQGIAVLLNGTLISWLIKRHQSRHSQFAAENEEMRQGALRDTLTGLINWHRFEQSVTTLLRQFPSHPLSLAMIDIDHFKIYNDTYGHIAGDRLLAEVARIIRREIPPECLAFRYGGEEFALLLPNFHTGQAFELADRLRRRIVESSLVGVECLPNSQLTISIGLASFPIHAQYPEQLIDRADEALYQAKEAGRNCVVHSEVKGHANLRMYGTADAPITVVK